MDDPDDTAAGLDLAAVEADDRLVEAVIAGMRPYSPEPIEARLIELLICWRIWVTHGPSARRYTRGR